MKITRLTITTILVAIIFISFLATVFHHRQMNNSVTLVVDIEIETDRPSGVTQLFYNTGKGYNQDESVIRGLQNATLINHKYDFIYKGEGHDLRFDLLNGYGRVTLHNLKFLLYAGNVEVPISSNQVLPLNQIESINVLGDNVVEVTTIDNANDPQVIISVPEKLLSQKKIVAGYLIGFFLKLTCVIFSMLCVILIITVENRDEHLVT